jgi:hypothetical protein
MKSWAFAAVLFGLSAGSATASTDQIKFYTTEYIGDDIAYENVGCGKPEIPALSRTKSEIKKVSDAMDAWRNCYNAYTERLAALQPVGKALPAGLAESMTPEQLSQAKNRMARVYNAVMDDAEAVAKSIMASHSDWMAKTDEYVKLENSRQKDVNKQLDTMYRDTPQDRGTGRGALPSAGGNGGGKH